MQAECRLYLKYLFIFVPATKLINKMGDKTFFLFLFVYSKYYYVPCIVNMGDCFNYQISSIILMVKTVRSFLGAIQ